MDVDTTLDLLCFLLSLLLALLLAFFRETSVNFGFDLVGSALDSFFAFFLFLAFGGVGAAAAGGAGNAFAVVVDDEVVVVGGRVRFVRGGGVLGFAGGGFAFDEVGGGLAFGELDAGGEVFFKEFEVFFEFGGGEGGGEDPGGVDVVSFSEDFGADEGTEEAELCVFEEELFTFFCIEWDGLRRLVGSSRVSRVYSLIMGGSSDSAGSLVASLSASAGFSAAFASLRASYSVSQIRRSFAAEARISLIHKTRSLCSSSIRAAIVTPICSE